MKKEKLFTSLFFVVSIGYVLGIVLDNPTLKFLFKPLIIVSLMAVYTSVVKKRNKLYVAALFFSLIGDTFLLYPSEKTFMFGLISFLLTHVFIILILFKEFRLTHPRQKLLALVPFFILFYALIDFLKDDLNQLLIPVIIYALIITFFGIMALSNYLENRSKDNLLIMVGALLFICSDSILAINKFSIQHTFFPIFVIITYIGAQFLICRYMIENKVVKG